MDITFIRVISGGDCGGLGAPDHQLPMLLSIVAMRLATSVISGCEASDGN
jgi:hypothetical protein